MIRDKFHIYFFALDSNQLTTLIKLGDQPDTFNMRINLWGGNKKNIQAIILNFIQSLRAVLSPILVPFLLITVQMQNFIFITLRVLSLGLSVVKRFFWTIIVSHL